MTAFSRALKVLLLAGLILVVLAPPAHAYLDPGTGSYVFQVLIAGLVGAAFGIKMFWRRIKGFFMRLFGRKPAAEGEDIPQQT